MWLVQGLSKEAAWECLVARCLAFPLTSALLLLLLRRYRAAVPLTQPLANVLSASSPLVLEGLILWIPQESWKKTDSGG